MNAFNKVLAIVGPTASGKTALAIKIAEKLANAEIISADSRQIYRGMDIGTAKPTREELARIPHHLIDIRNPDEKYSLAEYQNDAILAIREILNRGKLPMLVGGTGLYIRAVLENWDIPQVEADNELRKKLESEVKKEGLEKVFKKLLALDPEAENIVDKNNPRRVIRALEVATLTGAPFTSQRKKLPPLFDALTLGISTTPEILRERINKRIDEMIAGGLIEETKKIAEIYGEDAYAIKDAIGYPIMLKYIKGECSLREAVDEFKNADWQYARRQMTWFRKDKSIQWIKSEDEAIESVKKFLEIAR